MTFISMISTFFYIHDNYPLPCFGIRDASRSLPWFHIFGGFNSFCFLILIRLRDNSFICSLYLIFFFFFIFLENDNTPSYIYIYMLLFLHYFPVLLFHLLWLKIYILLYISWCRSHSYQTQCFVFWSRTQDFSVSCTDDAFIR